MKIGFDYIPESELESFEPLELGDLSVKGLFEVYDAVYSNGDMEILDFGGKDVEELGKGSLKVSDVGRGSIADR
jgi:hypothetical protein